MFWPTDYEVAVEQFDNDALGRNYYILFDGQSIEDGFLVTETTASHFTLPGGDPWRWGCSGRPAYPAVKEIHESHVPQLEYILSAQPEGLYHIKFLGMFRPDSFDATNQAPDEKQLNNYFIIRPIDADTDIASYLAAARFVKEQAGVGEYRKAVAATVGGEVFHFLWTGYLWIGLTALVGILLFRRWSKKKRVPATE